MTHWYGRTKELSSGSFGMQERRSARVEPIRERDIETRQVSKLSIVKESRYVSSAFCHVLPSSLLPTEPRFACRCFVARVTDRDGTQQDSGLFLLKGE